MRSRLFLPWSLLAGLLALVVATEGLKATALVLGKLKAKPSPEPIAVSEEAEGVTEAEADAEGSNSNSTRSLLTGIPQLDYVHDPNLPRELNGYNLTEYPFYDRVPEDLDFKCDGLHDGFYASVPHKCQVYHHCLFGTRYDFLCANYTAFDQKTFICHFVSEVDCVNSHKYFKRNEALYKAATTTTPSTTTTTQAAPPPPPPPPPQRRPHRPGGRRRPYRRRPVYEYYYDDDYDEDYYDEVPATGKESGLSTGPGRHFKNQSRRLTPVSEPEHDSTHSEDTDTPQEPTADVKPRTSSVYDRPRVPPKIRRPVPINEREKYEYIPQKQAPVATSDERVQRPKQNAKTSTPAPEAEDDFYDDEEEYVAPPRSSASGSRRKNQPSEYYPTAPEREIVRRPVMSGGRNVRRKGPGGRRRGSGQVDTATMYTPIEDEDYEEEELPRRPIRPSGGRRRAHVSYRDEYSSQSRQPTRSKYEDEEEEEEDEDPVPAPRPAYISPSGGSRQGFVVRKRVQPQQPDVLPTTQGGFKRSSNSRKQPHPATAYAEEEDDEEYYDDEEEEPESVYQPRSKQSSRPNVQSNFGPTAGDSQQRQSPNKRPYSSSRAGSASSPRTSQVQSGKISYENVKDEESVKQVRGQTQGQIFDDIRDASSTVRPKVTRGKFTSNVNDEFSEEVKSDPPSSKPADNEKPLPANNGRSPFEDQPARTFPTSFSNFRNKFQPSGLGGSKPRTNTETEKLSSDGFTSPAKTETVDNTNSEPKTVSTIPSKSGHGLPILTKVIVKPLGGRTVDIPDNPEKNNLADLNDHDIDVTINDALHPTLHPTRSIASEFVPRTQEETQRGSGLKRPTSSTRYQSQNSDAINRPPSQLVSSQSQRLITRAPFDTQSRVKQPYDDADTSIETSSPQSIIVQYNEPQNGRRQPQLRYQQVNIPVSSLGTGSINVQTRHQQRPLYSQ